MKTSNTFGLTCLGLVAAIGMVLSGSVRGEDFSWPNWRGPNHDDISRETGLLKEWPTEGPKRLWLNQDVGLGYSGYSIVGDKLFTMGLRDDKEFVVCVNANDGKTIWEAPIGSRLENGWGDGPRSTPTVQGDFVFALGGLGDIACLAVADGQLKWTKSAKDFGGGKPGWGYCESVLVDGERVVFTPGGKQGSVVALNKETGETIWQAKSVTDGAQYASIVPVNIHGQRQYIQLFQDRFVGLAAETGDLKWEAEWQGKTAVIPTPIYHDGFVYITSGYGVGCKLVRIGQSNQTETIYDNKNMKNHHGGVVLVDGYLYGYSDGVGWICQDFKSGEIVWSNKQDLGKGCIACADGMLYCVDESKGTVVLLKATPEKWEEHGRFTLEPQTQKRNPKGRIWTHPVVCNGKLYLRDQELLSCYQVKP